MTPVYQNLLGREFHFGTMDCYTLLQDFYAQCYGIILPNYARPTDFWEKGMDLYRDRAFRHGFLPLDCHPMDYQTGDVVLMAISSTVGNHVGIITPGNNIVHHLWGRLSTEELYRGLFQNTTLGVFRHKDVPLEMDETTSDITDYLSDRVKAEARELLSSS